jgi:hypothetical protein
MKYGFVLTDSVGNDYRTISTSITKAIEKVASENDLNEDGIVNAKRGDSVGSLGL